jgi:hypothetical protein
MNNPMAASFLNPKFNKFKKKTPKKEDCDKENVKLELQIFILSNEILKF